MKLQASNAANLFNRQPFTANGEFFCTNALKAFVPPKTLAEAGVAHWFSRGWRRSARDLSDFMNPAACDFET